MLSFTFLLFAGFSAVRTLNLTSLQVSNLWALQILRWGNIWEERCLQNLLTAVQGRALQWDTGFNLHCPNTFWHLQGIDRKPWTLRHGIGALSGGKRAKVLSDNAGLWSHRLSECFKYSSGEKFRYHHHFKTSIVYSFISDARKRWKKTFFHFPEKMINRVCWE